VFGREFLLVSFTVDSRLAAFGAMRDSLDALGVLEQSEIAFYDQDEQFWRTVHPLPAEPFDRFLTPERFAFAHALLNEMR
jgi:hypothetical protein